MTNEELAEVERHMAARNILSTLAPCVDPKADYLRALADDVPGLFAEVGRLKIEAAAGKALAERVLECSSEVPHSVKVLAFAFFGKPCGGMCCTQKPLPSVGS